MFGKKKQQAEEPEKNLPDGPVTTQTIMEKMSCSTDVYYSDIIINNDTKQKFTIVFMDGLIDQNQIDNFVLKPLIQQNALGAVKTEQELSDLIMLGAVYHSRRSVCDKLSYCLDKLLGGSVLMVFDTLRSAIAFEVEHIEKRAITEPTNENVLKGSKESFIEVLRTNTSLVRRRIRTCDLKISTIQIGKRTHTSVAIVYLDGVANTQIIKEIQKRLNQIDTDGVISAGQIESNIIDNKYALFPQMLYTERVDKFCANILEGRVGIMIDGIPIVYVVPVDINSFMQAPEDYALNFMQSSFFRFLRYSSSFIALTLPAFWVAVTTFHQEMIPTKLATSIIESRQGVPFPTFIEVLLMLFAFEVLLEAGLRLPRAVGQAVSIVGAIVIGQAAITAHILSPGVVIAISTAGIAGFTLPSQDYSNAVRICRVFLVLTSIISGLFTVTIGLILILYHACTLENFNVPYLSPFVANEGRKPLRDTLIRPAWFRKSERPSSIGVQDQTRGGG